MKSSLRAFLQSMLASASDLLPIVLVIAFFQIVVLQQPLEHIGALFTGIFFVVVGLTFFIYGLNMGLFPIGESMAHAFARKGSVFWLLVFSFALGFGTTVAEPALVAIADEAARVAADAGVIESGKQALDAYADGLRYTVALSVGVALVIGVLRILLNWRLAFYDHGRIYPGHHSDHVCTGRHYWYCI